MSILETKVMLNIDRRNIDFYRNKGYKIPLYKDINGNFRVKRGTKILVDVKDLKDNCHIKLTKICDFCGKKKLISFFDILQSRNYNNGVDKCKECSDKEKIKEVNNKKLKIIDTNPEFVDLLWNKNDAFNYTIQSNKKINFKCPKCGEKIIDKRIQDIYKYGLSCSRCSDGFSYPEKFMTNFLTQLEIKFETQKTFDWSLSKRYDFYIPSLSCIIETHGMQHYKRGFENIGGKNSREEQENDFLKEKLAKDNGIKHYIVIDCRKSDLEWIKNNMLSSEMNCLFNFSNINWLKIHEFSCNSIVKLVCELWNKDKNISKISKDFKISKYTIRRYLKKGAEIGWCDYDAEKNKIKSKKIIQLALNGELINEYNSITEAGIKTNINFNLISFACNGRQKTAGNYIWIFKDNYDKNVDYSLRKPYKRKIVQLTQELKFINEWDSISDASKYLQIKNISSACNGKYKSAGGFKWMYKEDYEKLSST